MFSQAISLFFLLSARLGRSARTQPFAVKETLTHPQMMNMSKALLIFVPLGVIFSVLNLVILLLAYREQPGSSTTDRGNSDSELDLSRIDRGKIFKEGMRIFLAGVVLFGGRNFLSNETHTVIAFVLYAIGTATMHFSLVWNNPLRRGWKFSAAAASLIIIAGGIVFILLFPQSN